MGACLGGRYKTHDVGLVCANVVSLGPFAGILALAGGDTGTLANWDEASYIILLILAIVAMLDTLSKTVRRRHIGLTPIFPAFLVQLTPSE